MYDYETQKQKLFTDEGQRLFLVVRDKVKKILETSGAITMESAIKSFAEESWTLLACVDRMVELDELTEIPNPTSKMGQNRIFVRKNLF